MVAKFCSFIHRQGKRIVNAPSDRECSLSRSMYLRIHPLCCSPRQKSIPFIDLSLSLLLSKLHLQATTGDSLFPSRASVCCAVAASIAIRIRGESRAERINVKSAYLSSSPILEIAIPVLRSQPKRQKHSTLRENQWFPHHTVKTHFLPSRKYPDPQTRCFHFWSPQTVQCGPVHSSVQRGVMITSSPKVALFAIPSPECRTKQEKARMLMHKERSECIRVHGRKRFDDAASVKTHTRAHMSFHSSYPFRIPYCE